MEQKELEKLASDTNARMIRVEAAIMGDGMGSIGLVEQIKDNKKEINQTIDKLDKHIKGYEADRNRKKGMVNVFLFLWTFLIWALGKFL